MRVWIRRMGSSGRDLEKRRRTSCSRTIPRPLLREFSYPGESRFAIWGRRNAGGSFGAHRHRNRDSERLVQMLCPKCKTDNAHRSHRVGLRERFGSIAGYHPYRCHDCQHRFVTRRYPSPELGATAGRSTAREVSSTRGALRWKRKRRDLVLFVGALIVFGMILYYLTRAPSMGD